MQLELTPEQVRFQKTVRDFAATAIAPRALEIDASDRFPHDLVSAAAALGLLGVTVPSAAGGAGRDYVSYALAVEEVAAASATLGAILVVNNSLVAELVHRFGTTGQKDAWLARLASGRAVGAFALSEAQAGTDAASQETAATAQGDGYVLRGCKVWVANGAAADVAVIFAASGAAAAGRGVSAFLVPLDRPGLTREATGDPLGVRGLGCVDLRLEDVEVPASALLAGPGRGFDVAKWALDGARVAIGAAALGVGRAAFDEAFATRPHAGDVRTSHREVPGDPVADCRHRDRTGRGPDARPARRGGQGRARADHAGSIDGEAGRLGGGAARGGSGDADSRLGRLSAGNDRGAAAARCAGPGDRGRNLRGAADDHRRAGCRRSSLKSPILARARQRPPSTCFAMV